MSHDRAHAHSEHPDGEDLCSIEGTLDVIGDRWTLLVLRDAFRGIRRFDQLQADLGVARNILADRLTRLAMTSMIGRPAKAPINCSRIVSGRVCV